IQFHGGFLIMAVIERGFQIPGSKANTFAQVIGATGLASDAILGAVQDTGSSQTISLATASAGGTAIQALDRPRRMTATVAAGTANDIKNIQVTVAGTDILGNSISEALPAFTDNTAGTVVGLKVFATVTSITIPAHDGTSATTSVGAAALPSLGT